MNHKAHGPIKCRNGLLESHMSKNARQWRFHGIPVLLWRVENKNNRQLVYCWLAYKIAAVYHTYNVSNQISQKGRELTVSIRIACIANRLVQGPIEFSQKMICIIDEAQINISDWSPEALSQNWFLYFSYTVIFMMLVWFCLKFLCWKGKYWNGVITGYIIQWWVTHNTASSTWDGLYIL